MPLPFLRFHAIVIFLPVATLSVTAAAGVRDSSHANPGPVCGSSTAIEDQFHKDAAACPILGDCDLPEFRDAAYPTVAQPMKTYRVLVHILANDDGSNPAVGMQALSAQMQSLNQTFAAHRIQFQWISKIDSATQFRNIPLITGPESNQMKNALAVAPGSQLNIYITDTDPSGGTGIAAFLGSALTATGGVVIDNFWIYGGGHVLTHEVGHVFGLHHTHRGVSEAGECSSCYERADGIEGDLRGDFCSDTPPTPVNYTCSQPGGVDPCSEMPWGLTLIQNFMGYAHPSCMTSFTPHQVGRMHCWIDARLSPWLTCEGILPPTGSDSLGDWDFDGWGIADDNCPYAFNPCQEDLDTNGVGDVCECACDCPGDPACNGTITNIVDVSTTISVAFRGSGAIDDPSSNCPGVISDVDCSGATDLVDVVKVVHVAFRAGDPDVEFCNPCDP